MIRRAVIAATAALLVAGCAGTQRPPGCSIEDIAARTALLGEEYLGKLVDECLLAGFPERAKCPAAKRLEAEYDAKVKALGKECGG